MEKSSTEKQFNIDEKTRRIMELLDSILLTSSKDNRLIVVGGGIGLEIKAANLRSDEQLTRNHGDLDIHPLVKDIPFWRDWFSEKGFILGTNSEIKDKSVAFVAHSPDSTFDENDPEACFYVDVYGLKIDNDGFVYSPESGDDEPWEKNQDNAFEKVFWHNYEVKVINHLDALKNKRITARQMSTSLREVDFHDHKLFAIDPNSE